MALDFSGSSQSLGTTATPSEIQITGDLTCCFTVVTDTTAAGFSAVANCQAVAGTDSDSANNSVWYFGRSGNQWVAFHEYGAGTNQIITLTTPTISTATVYRVCVRRNVSAKTYEWTINGTTYTGVSYTNDPTGGGNGYVSIGEADAIGGAGGQEWNGTIEEVAVYDTYLTQGEAEAYTNGAAPSLIRPSAGVSYYPLLGIGNVGNDWWLQNHLATVNGPPSAVDSQSWRRAGSSIFVEFASGGGGGGFQAAWAARSTITISGAMR